MEEFYSLLRKYNDESYLSFLPKWTGIYREPEAPVYWYVLKNILVELPNNYTIFEIGSGTGDLLALIYDFGFKNIKGSEKDVELCSIANEKMKHFFGIEDIIENKNYPYDIDRPNVLLQINCVYFDKITTKQEYLTTLKGNYDNANPDYYIVEVIDDSFKEENSIFPNFVRLSKKDLENTFVGKSIKYFHTYKYPINTSSKTIYIIS